MAERIFYCGPRRAIGDGRLSALDHRVLAVVALHDGMSLTKGKGAGCYATYRTLSAEVGCDYTNFSKSIARLLRWSYLVREPQVMDKRKFTLRVVYSGADSWQNDQQSCDRIVGETTNEPSEIVGQHANCTAEIVGHEKSERRRNQPKTALHYISLKEELDSVETGKIDSAKQRCARFVDQSDDGTFDQAEAPSRDEEMAWQDGVQSHRRAPAETETEILTDIGWGRTAGQALAQYERRLKSAPHTMDLMAGQQLLATMA